MKRVKKYIIIMGVVILLVKNFIIMEVIFIKTPINPPKNVPIIPNISP